MNIEEACDVMNGIVHVAWANGGYDDANMRWTDVAGDVPTTEVIWCRVTIKHTDGGQTSFGDATSRARRFSNTGTLWVQCFTPVGAGLVLARRAAQLVVTAIRDSKNEDVWFRNARMKEVGTSGAFEQINVLADFTYDQ